MKKNRKKWTNKLLKLILGRLPTKYLSFDRTNPYKASFLSPIILIFPLAISDAEVILNVIMGAIRMF